MLPPSLDNISRESPATIETDAPFGDLPLPAATVISPALPDSLLPVPNKIDPDEVEDAPVNKLKDPVGEESLEVETETLESPMIEAVSAVTANEESVSNDMEPELSCNFEIPLRRIISPALPKKESPVDRKRSPERESCAFENDVEIVIDPLLERELDPEKMWTEPDFAIVDEPPSISNTPPFAPAIPCPPINDTAPPATFSPEDSPPTNCTAPALEYENGDPALMMTSPASPIVPTPLVSTKSPPEDPSPPLKVRRPPSRLESPASMLTAPPL